LLIRAFSCVLVALILVEQSAQDIESPRLQTLRSAVALDSGGALESFWKEIAEKKAPLIERLDEHQGYALVTFLWRGEPRTQRVSVIGQLGQLTGTRSTDNVLTRLTGTNLWYRSYWLRSDVRTIYRFVVEVEGNDGPRDYPDPFAPRWAPVTDNNFRVEWSILELPRAEPQPWIAPRPDVPPGRTDHRTAGRAESEWLAKQFAAAARSNVKFYMDVGLLEGESTGGAPLNWLTMVDQPIPYGPSLLLANRHMRDILRLKGYQVHYAEFSGGHNALSWRGTFGDALMLAAASGLDRELREDVTMKAIDGPVARLTSTGVGTPLHRSGPSIPQSDHRHPSSIPRSR